MNEMFDTSIARCLYLFTSHGSADRTYNVYQPIKRSSSQAVRCLRSAGFADKKPSDDSGQFDTVSILLAKNDLVFKSLK